jgi:hypothetical protein
MCYDKVADALVLSQQGSNQALKFVNPTNGNAIKSISHSLNHQTGVACAQNPQEYFVSDYSGNSGGLDLYKITASGSKSTASSEKQSYGGYPMTMYGDSTLIRGQHTNNYNFNINSIRFASRNSLDSITKTANTGLSSIGDLCYNGANVFAMNYDSSLSGRRLHETDETEGPMDTMSRRRLGTGFTINGLDPVSFQVDSKLTTTGNCPSGTTPAALACEGSKMWLFCWTNGGTGKILTFNT